MKKNLTIIKVASFDTMLDKNEIIKEEISRENIEYDDNNCLMVVKIGDENYHPTPKDLEEWRDVFLQAKNDEDFKIFTSYNVNIDVINFDKSGNVVVKKD